jgi:hypothetical protein
MDVSRKNLMESVRAHVGEMETQLERWSMQLDELVARARKAGAWGRSDHRERIFELMVKHRQAQWKLAELRAAGSQSWERVRAGIESVWNEVAAAFRELTN